jgi:hypothetical protein
VRKELKNFLMKLCCGAEEWGGRKMGVCGSNGWVVGFEGQKESSSLPGFYGAQITTIAV